MGQGTRLLCLVLLVALGTGCGPASKEQENLQVSVMTELEELIPSENVLFKRVGLYAEGKGQHDYRVVLESLDPRVKAGNDDAHMTTVGKLIPLTASSLFCSGSVLNSVAERALTEGGSVRLVFTDNAGEKLKEYNIDSAFCHKNPSVLASEVRNNIRDDGVYTRRYLEKALYPVMVAQLPNQIDSEFEMSKVELGRGSSVMLTVKYTPKDQNMREELAVDKAGEMLQHLYAAACRSPDTQELIRRLDMFGWQVEWQGKIITKIVASPTCR